MFKIGDKVVLNSLGKESWDYQENGVGTIKEIIIMRWNLGRFKDSTLVLYVCWENKNTYTYPDEALELAYQVDQVKSILPEPIETIISNKSDYFSEEKELSLEEYLKTL